MSSPTRWLAGSVAPGPVCCARNSTGPVRVVPLAWSTWSPTRWLTSGGMGWSGTMCWNTLAKMKPDTFGALLYQEEYQPEAYYAGTLRFYRNVAGLEPGKTGLRWTNRSSISR